jgi:hypothetical protein
MSLSGLCNGDDGEYLFLAKDGTCYLKKEIKSELELSLFLFLFLANGYYIIVHQMSDG